MDVVMWVVSGLLAATFLVAGGSKLIRSRQQLLDTGQMGWVDDFADGPVKLIGALEVLAAIGLVLPWAFDVAPVLTPLAGTGLALLMAGAVVTHVRRKEQFVPPLVLLVIALFVAILRFVTL
jgi:uncharacterized membrane protein YphA (DoxX/SURF4 family)